MVPMKDKIRGANGGVIEVLGLADIPLELLFQDSHSMQHTTRWYLRSGLHA